MTTFERLSILYKELADLNNMNEVDFTRENGKAQREALEKKIRQLENEYINFNF